ncbi:MAG: DUF6636 domain-containing protein [Chloroflexota bacterium]
MVRLAALLVLAIGVWVAQPATLALAKVAQFRTPSGNIGCVAFTDHHTRYVRCDIGNKSWRGPKRPASCPLDYGNSFTMAPTRRPVWTCHGDTALGAGRVLRYGATWHWGPFTCASRVRGLTCTNRAGHGFFLSRQRYRIF